MSFYIAVNYMTALSCNSKSYLARFFHSFPRLSDNLTTTESTHSAG